MKRSRERLSPEAAPCPCGRGLAYGVCCARWHRGESAPDAEALMRSRYAAYVLGLPDYLYQTWHPQTRPPMAELAEPSATQWQGLTVLDHAPAGERAEVEFVARFKVNGRAGKLHERSRFERHEGRWVYRDGDVSPD